MELDDERVVIGQKRHERFQVKLGKCATVVTAPGRAKEDEFRRRIVGAIEHFFVNPLSLSIVVFMGEEVSVSGGACFEDFQVGVFGQMKCGTQELCIVVATRDETVPFFHARRKSVCFLRALTGIFEVVDHFL